MSCSRYGTERFAGKFMPARQRRREVHVEDVGLADQSRDDVGIPQRVEVDLSRRAVKAERPVDRAGGDLVRRRRRSARRFRGASASAPRAIPAAEPAVLGEVARAGRIVGIRIRLVSPFRMLEAEARRAVAVIVLLRRERRIVGNVVGPDQQLGREAATRQRRPLSGTRDAITWSARKHLGCWIGGPVSDHR